MSEQESENKLSALQALAEAMLDAGCEVSIALADDGHAVLAIADGYKRLNAVAFLRQMADSVEQDAMNLIGHVQVEREE